METAYLLSILPGSAICLVTSGSVHVTSLRMSLDTDVRSLEHGDNQGPTFADDELGAETRFSNDDINNNVIPDNNNNTAEEAEINNNNITEHVTCQVTVTSDDDILTQRPPNPVPAPPLYIPQEPQVIQPPPPSQSSLCPCPAVYNDPGASYYHLPPPDYQELSPANLPLQPNLPRYHNNVFAYSLSSTILVNCAKRDLHNRNAQCHVSDQT